MYKAIGNVEEERINMLCVFVCVCIFMYYCTNVSAVCAI